MSLVLKRKNNSADITAYDDAMLIYASLGDGILNGVYDGFALSFNTSSKVLSISSGVCVFGGRMAVVGQGTTHTLDLTSFSQNNAYIMLEMTIDGNNDANSSVTIYASQTDTSTSDSPLIAGTHRICLATLDKSTGAINVVITKIKPGVANNALNLSKEGMIGTVSFQDIFLDDVSGVRYAKSSDVAAVANGFVGSDNEVGENLYMPYRGVYLLQRIEFVNDNISRTIANGSSTTIDFKHKADMNSKGVNIKSGTKIVQYIADDGSHNITFPEVNSHNALLGQFTANNKLIKKYLGLEITIDKSNKRVVLANNTGSSVTLSGLKLFAYGFGGY